MCPQQHIHYIRFLWICKEVFVTLHKFYIINKNGLLYFHKLPIENHEKVWYTIGEEKEDGPMG